MVTWQDLRELREGNDQPTFPVVIATSWSKQVDNLEECGFMVIRHEPGTPMPLELLTGLRVWCFLGDCDKAQSILRLLRKKSMHIPELSAWCECRQTLHECPIGCERERGLAAFIAEDEALRAAKAPQS